MTNLNNARHSVSQSNTTHHVNANGRNSTIPPPGTPRGVHGMSMEDLSTPDLEKGNNGQLDDKPKTVKKVTKRNWYGKKRTVVVEEASGAEVADLEMLPEGVAEPRPAMLYAPIYNGLACGLSVCELACWFCVLRYPDALVFPVFLGNGVNILLQEFELDGSFMRFALVATIPLLFAVSLVSYRLPHLLRRD